MIRNILFIIMILGMFTKSYAKYENLAYNFSFKSIDGGIIPLSNFKNSVIVVVNVASRCGYTPQYTDLQKIWSNYKKDKFIVIGVPTNNFKQEPGSNEEIKKFCETNFGISFPITEKVDVIGNNAHPFFKWARKNHGLSAIPKWNFHKIIINKEGKVSTTFSSFTNPTSKKFIDTIEKELKM